MEKVRRVKKSMPGVIAKAKEAILKPAKKNVLKKTRL